jgi:predicted ribosome quality control (RQC) complex YloA/Tae2 family protein
MDHLTLHLITSELRSELLGHRLSSIKQLEEETFLFYFFGDYKKRLFLSAKPGHPRMHLIRKRYPRREVKILSGFQSLLRQSLEELSLLAIEKEREERLIRFRFGEPSENRGAEFFLMAELLGRSSNLILTDEKGKVLGFCRKLKSEFRQPIVGYPYQPPLKAKTSPFQFLVDSELDEALAKDQEKALSFILDSMKGVSVEIAKEIVKRGLEKGSFSHVLNGVLEEYKKEGTRAYIYSSSPVESIGEDLNLTRKNFILSPMALHAIKNMNENEYPTLNEAAEDYYSLLIRNETFARRKNHVGKMIRKEKERMNSTLSNLQRDKSKFENPARFRQYGEMILAGLKSAKVKDDYAEVDDCYHPQERMKIPIEPSLSLTQNAERYFKKYRKAERGILKIDERENMIKKRMSRLEQMAIDLKESVETSGLEKIQEKLRGEGIVTGIKVRGKGILDSGPEITGIRLYRSSDGMQILVGKTARDNMKLSFKISSPEDFWLHASGYGGAHVVIRNPSNLKKVPEKTLIEAAKLAAFYSSGKREGKVEVHYSKKKYVRKGKKLRLGTVLVKRFESVLVEPENLFKDE